MRCHFECHGHNLLDSPMALIEMVINTIVPQYRSALWQVKMDGRLRVLAVGKLSSLEEVRGVAEVWMGFCQSK